MPLLDQGQVIRETYEIERFLGEGAFAEVYRARHRFLGKQALKLLKLPGVSVAEVQSMLGEAVLLTKINHPNIIRVFEANTVEIDHQVFGYFTMEYVAGGSLDRFWRSYGTQFVPVATSVELTKQVCRGLAIAHRQDPSIIHRDIKPQNILVGYEPDGIRARISDFGLAKEVNPLTLMATARGTRMFKAPEALADLNGDSSAGDVWALGMTLYLLLTDKVPFEEPDDYSLVSSTTSYTAKPAPPSQINPLCDARLDAIVLRSLAFEPKERYRSASEMLPDLEAWIPKLERDFGSSDQQDWSTSKDVLGRVPAASSQDPCELAARAIEIAQDPDNLNEAADLMEEAFNRLPKLREQYRGRVTLWRRGISM